MTILNNISNISNYRQQQNQCRFQLFFQFYKKKTFFCKLHNATVSTIGRQKRIKMKEIIDSNPIDQ